MLKSLHIEAGTLLHAGKQYVTCGMANALTHCSLALMSKARPKQLRLVWN